MHTRTLGALEVSALGLGCMGISQTYGPNPGDRSQMVRLIRHAVEGSLRRLRTDHISAPRGSRRSHRG